MWRINEITCERTENIAYLRVELCVSYPNEIGKPMGDSEVYINNCSMTQSLGYIVLDVHYI